MSPNVRTHHYGSPSNAGVRRARGACVGRAAHRGKLCRFRAACLARAPVESDHAAFLRRDHHGKYRSKLRSFTKLVTSEPLLMSIAPSERRIVPFTRVKEPPR